MRRIVKWPVLLLMVAATALFLGCGSNRKVAGRQSGVPGIYVSGLPVPDTSFRLDRIARSVKKIYSVSSYTTYRFRLEARVTWHGLRQGNWQRNAWGVIATSETQIGTATVIGSGHGLISLLTSAHIVTTPDTLVTWFETTDDDPTPCMESLSVREKQEHWIKELSPCGPFKTLASDADLDVAILGKRCESAADTAICLVSPAGISADLGWGSEVCIFGYPTGGLTLTRGLVSPASNRPMGEFTVDALLNKGYSGGLLLAFRNDGSGPEVVGMVRNVSSIRDEYLKPAAGQSRMPDWIPYEGASFIGSLDQIHYGLNNVVTMEAIINFYRENRDELIRNGCNLDAFFRPDKP